MSKSPAWSPDELETLRRVYPAGGSVAAVANLPGRSQRSIQVMACRLKLVTTARNHAPRLAIAGDTLAAVMALHDLGWGSERIARKLGLRESSISNAVIIEVGRRKGYNPLPRDQYGALLPESLEKLRLLMRKGWKSRDIQERCGLSAGCVSEQRKRYARELKARGLAPLPPPGGGAAYSGKRVSVADRLRIEALYMEGLGAQKIHEATGVSKTSVTRIRRQLVKRLARKGECLPGCDRAGVRHVHFGSARFVTAEQEAALRVRILAREPTKRAARDLGIGECSAYRIRNQLRDELAARGETLPEPIRPGRVKSALHPARTAQWLPVGAKWIYAYRKLLQSHSPAEAKAMILEQIEDTDRQQRTEAEAQRKASSTRGLSFDEQLARVRAGQASIVPNIPIPGRALPDMTLGGVASGQLA